MLQTLRENKTVQVKIWLQRFSKAIHNTASVFSSDCLSWEFSGKTIFSCKVVIFFLLPTFVLKIVFLFQKENRCWSIQRLSKGSSCFESIIYCLLAGKVLHCANGLSHQKSKYMFDFWLDPVQKCRIFFLRGNPT